MGEIGGDGSQFLQQIPSFLLVDNLVGVVGFDGGAVGGVGDAAAQAQGDEGEEGSDFGFVEGIGGVVASDDMSSSGEGVVCVHHDVGGGDGEFGDEVAVEHVAEVYEAGDGAGLAGVRADQYVVVVGIVVDNGRS